VSVLTLEVARDAVSRNDWASAIEAFDDLASETYLSADDLVLLGDALWWSARPDEAEDAYERAFEGFAKTDRKGDAAKIGAILAYLAMRRLSASVAMGWVARTQSLLVDEPECPGHAWLSMLSVAEALFVLNDLQLVEERADKTIGRRRRRSGSADAGGDGRRSGSRGARARARHRAARRAHGRPGGRPT
jgi:hypothetical protein